MAAPKGNQYWKLIDPENIGRNPIFKTPKELWERCVEYFEWIDENPIVERESSTGGVNSYQKEKEHQRPYTWEGLYAFLGIYDLEHYKTKEAFSQIIKHISNIIYSNKFEGASVGVFNSNIIARDLGLKDKQEVDNKTEHSIAPKTLEDWYDKDR